MELNEQNAIINNSECVAVKSVIDRLEAITETFCTERAGLKKIVEDFLTTHELSGQVFKKPQEKDITDTGHIGHLRVSETNSLTMPVAVTFTVNCTGRTEFAVKELTNNPVNYCIVLEELIRNYEKI